MTKRVLILGSTGSIGKNALKVLENFRDRFKVVGLAARNNVNEMLFQVERFKPEAVYMFNGKLNADVKTYGNLRSFIDDIDFDICISAISGSDGILPTYWASRKAKRLAIANKESLVCAGNFIMNSPSEIIPVDSEHSAIFQCLQGNREKDLSNLILTASGGPFWSRKDLNGVTVEEALNHPNWKMGKKVTIDSATMMNKGLEVIEAHWLFGVEPDRIEVLIHPQSIVHSMVRFMDGSVISQMAIPDMRIPIAYALSYPNRLPLKLPSLNLSGRSLTFEKPDISKFKCLGLAYKALKAGYPYPIVLNAADEVAVNLFLNGKIGFADIPSIVEETLSKTDLGKPSSIEDVVEINTESKGIASEVANAFR